MPPLPSTRHCPAYPFWMPTQANKKYCHWEICVSVHNLACSMIFKAISKTGSLGSCFVCMDIGSSKRLVMQNLQIPDTAETRIIPKWFFPPRCSDKNRITSSHPDAVLVAPISAKTKQQQTSNEGGWVLRSGRGQLRGTGSSSAAPPATSRLIALVAIHLPQTAPTQRSWHATTWHSPQAHTCSNLESKLKHYMGTYMYKCIYSINCTIGIQ